MRLMSYSGQRIDQIGDGDPGPASTLAHLRVRLTRADRTPWTAFTLASTRPMQAAQWMFGSDSISRDGAMAASSANGRAAQPGDFMPLGCLISVTAKSRLSPRSRHAMWHGPAKERQ
jgi:hypothetical protein